MNRLTAELFQRVFCLFALLADFQFLDDLAVAFNVLFHQVIEQAAAFSDHPQQADPRVIVFLMRIEVRRECVDVCGKNGDLDFRGAGIVRRLAVLLDEFCLLTF